LDSRNFFESDVIVSKIASLQLELSSCVECESLDDSTSPMAAPVLRHVGADLTDTIVLAHLALVDLLCYAHLASAHGFACSNLYGQPRPLAPP